MIYKRIRQYSSSSGGNLHLLLVVALLLPLMAIAPAEAPAVARAQDVLLQLAEAQPEARVGVIVQKTVKDTRVEDLVARLGGAVTKDLSIINAFTAEMTAEDAVQLAQASGVRWVSLDAPTTSSADTCAITLNSVADTELDEEQPDVSDGSATTIDTLPSPIGKRAYAAIQFDLSGIPSDSNVTSATLGVYVKVHRTTAHSDPVHVITTPWTEAATWNKRDGMSTWTSGVFGSNDYAPTALGTIIPSTIGFKTLAVTSAVANWVSGSVANHGFLLLSTGTDTGAADMWHVNLPATNHILPSPIRVPAPHQIEVFLPGLQLRVRQYPWVSQRQRQHVRFGLGPNGTFGYGNKVKGSLGGFIAEVTPENHISKVELVMKSYMSKASTKTID